MAARKKLTTPSADHRTLLVKTQREGTFKITIPEDWKVTFSRFNQGAGMDHTTALRIYESETKQRACFTDVVSFRDLSLPVVRMVKHKSGEVTWQSDGDGNLTENRSVKAELREVEDY